MKVYEMFIDTYQYVVAFLTFFLSMTIIIVIIFNKELRNLPHSSILALTIAALIETGAKFILSTENFDPNTEASRCQFQGFLVIFGESSTYLWTLIIGYHVAQATLFSIDVEKHFVRKIIKAHLLGTFVPLIIAITMLFTNQIGPNGLFCYIKGEGNSLQVSWILLISFYWLVLIGNTLLTWAVLTKLKETFGDQDAAELIDGITYRYRLYPIVQLVCLLPQTIEGFFERDIERVFKVSYIISFIFLMLKPFLYVLAYGFTPAVARKFGVCQSEELDLNDNASSVSGEQQFRVSYES